MSNGPHPLSPSPFGRGGTTLDFRLPSPERRGDKRGEDHSTFAVAHISVLPMHRRKVGVLALGALAVAGLAFMWSARPAAPERLVGAVCRSRAGDERRTCYVRLLVGYLNKYGVARAVETLDSLAAADPEVAQHAHEYAHGIGMMAYDHAPDIATTFVDCGDGAASGCRHGFMQAYFQQRKQLGAADVRGLCQPLEAG